MTADPAALRRALVVQVRAQYEALGERVAQALETVPRHVFLPDVPLDEAYADDAIVTKRDADGLPISSSSQPTIMAVMLDQLGLAPGQRILEIGAGTGYNAALMAHVTGPSGEVVSLDIDADTVDRARANLAAAGFPGVRVVCADGAEGFAERAPYDRIIATVGVWDLAPAWLGQLVPGGRIVVPIDLRGVQRVVAFERADGYWRSLSVVPCGFMRLRGAFAGPAQVRLLDRESELSLTVPDGRAVDPDVLGVVRQPPTATEATGVTAEPSELFDGLSLWLAVREPRWCTLSEVDTGVALPAAPMRIQRFRLSVGVLDGPSVAVLTAPAGTGLFAVGYGPSAARLAADLAAHVRGWAGAGRQTSRNLRVDAYPRDTPDSVLSGRQVTDKQHTRLVLSWPAAEPAAGQEPVTKP